MNPEPRLEGKEVVRKVFDRLSSYEDSNLLEKYAYFMMWSQFLEMSLKHKLEEKTNLTEENTEKMTLGTLIRKLEDNSMRPDFISLLNNLLQYRNDFAHSFLLDNALGNEMVGQEFDRLSEKRLHEGLYKVHECIIVHDFLSENNLFFIES